MWKSFDENYDHVRPGRFSHVAHLLNKRILVVSGGFGGIVRDDLIAYKISSSLISDNQDYSCSVFKHCIHCLTWGSSSHVKCGWCVQDSTCYSRHNPLRACSKTKPPTKGWWGNKALFLKSFNQCRIYDDPPGLMAKIYFEDRLYDVYVISPLRDEDFYTSTRRLKLPPTNGLIKVSWTGFIYPFISKPSFDKDLVLHSHMNSASIRLSKDEQSINAVTIAIFVLLKFFFSLFSCGGKVYVFGNPQFSWFPEYELLNLIPYKQNLCNWSILEPTTLLTKSF